MQTYFMPCTDEENWRTLLADPEKHWKAGYSSFELAHAWMKMKQFPDMIQESFRKSNDSILINASILFAFPEYKVELDNGRAPSQNDLYVLAKSNDELMTIMVEGKVNESFGQLIGKWKVQAGGRAQRLEFLKQKLNLSDIPDDTYYQLLHRTASAIIEAERVSAGYAMMLVHSFSDKSASKNDRSYKEYAKFVKLFGLQPEINAITKGVSIPTEAGQIILYFGWVQDDLLVAVRRDKHL